MMEDMLRRVSMRISALPSSLSNNKKKDLFKPVDDSIIVINDSEGSEVKSNTKAKVKTEVSTTTLI
jgi:hypothetical protein